VKQAKKEQAEGAAARLRRSQQAMAGSVAESARRLSFGHVAKEWSVSQSKVHSDPADAITRACSLIESVCKHILDGLGQALPKKKTISSLYDEVTRSLGLRAIDAPNEETRSICQGLCTSVANIGALRTKAGTAHGRDASYTAPTEREARLAVNAAGVVATFMMEAYESQIASKTDANS